MPGLVQARLPISTCRTPRVGSAEEWPVSTVPGVISRDRMLLIFGG